MIHYIPAESDPTEILPPAMYPLPVPCRPVLKRSKVLDATLTFAENALSSPPTDTRFPRAIYRVLYAERKGIMRASYWAALAVNLEFYLRYANAKDDPKLYPRGVKEMLDDAREEVEKVVRQGRALDMASFIINDYADALRNCRWLCTATHLGHGPAVGAPMVFSAKDVEKAMAQTDNWTGLISYDHIRAQLMREVQ